MKIKYEEYNSTYHSSDGSKFIDFWQSGLMTLPFSAQPATSAFDDKCGLQGVAGEFMRLWERVDAHTINDFKADVEAPVRDYLLNEKSMEEEQIPAFLEVLKDILMINGNLNITNMSLLKHTPLIPQDDNLSKKERDKYSDGEKKLAKFVYSMLTDKTQIKSTEIPNLFTNILKDALQDSMATGLKEEESEDAYYIPAYIRDSFTKNIQWLCGQEDAVAVKNLPFLLYFYACYTVIQSLFYTNVKCKQEVKAPEPLYFILSTEKTSQSSEAYTKGFSQKLPVEYLNKTYGRKQALDIANTVLGGKVGLYYDVLNKLHETPFEENKELCEQVLSNYQEEKRKVFSSRKSEKELGEEIDVTVSSYDEFLEKLQRLCVEYQAGSYDSRIKKKITDLLYVRFLQVRRGKHILTIDNEMLIFLIAIFTESEKTKLEDMYKAFNSYGIYFNLSSRTAIEELLLKLNLLDRKSDSGEAQYVRVIL